MANFKKISVIFSFFILLSGVLLKSALATSSNLVTICHATNSASNPYVQESVNISSLGNGHGKNGINSGDIVPPVAGTDFTNGNNWTTPGQTIYNNNCVVPSVMSVLDCDGDTDGAYPDVDDARCVTPTPTVTPTPVCDSDHDDEDEDSYHDDVCITPTITPTVVPSVTPTVTPIPTQAPSNPGGPGDGRSDGRSDGHSSCPSCTQAPQTQVLGASTGPTQAVLGASTMAGTGTFENTLMEVMMIAGTVILGAGLKSYANEKKN